MNDQKKPDYLSRLPPELLHEVFEYAYDSAEPLTTPLSKSLLPFQELPLFKSIYAFSYHSLEALCKIAQRRPLALSHTRHLSISIPRKSPSTGATQESDDVKVPSNKLVRLLYRKLTDVNSLNLAGSSRLAQLVLDPAVAASAFPRLTNLSISSTFRTLRNPFHPIFYTTIQYYTELKVLRISVRRKAKSIQSYEKPLAEIPPLPTQVEDFTLRGPLGDNTSVVRSLIYSLGNLSALSLSDTSERPQVFSLLDGLFMPGKLSILSLDMQNTSGPRPSASDLAHLTGLTSLASLNLEGHASPFAYSSLQSVPLVSLTLGFGALVSLSELTRLITGPSKHETLMELYLDNLYGERGTTIEEAGEPYYDEETETMGVWPDWILPDWSDEFTEEGLVKFIKLAEKERIEVEGTAVGAIGIDEEFEEEEAMLAEFEEGLEDFDGCG